VKKVLKTLGMTDYGVRLSLRDPDSDKYVGDPENWDKAEAALREAVQTLGVEYTEEPGEATVQVDYNLPERFNLSYIGADNKAHRPIMIHRAPFGSMERFIGVLIEHFAGAFPLWLAPEQGRVLSVSEKSEEYARKIEQQLISAGLRVTGDYRSEKLGAKIRDGRLDMLPYMMIVGPRDAENGTVSVRDRVEGDLGAMPVAQAIARFQKEVDQKTVRQVYKNDAPGGGSNAKNEY